jgi:hypothetical protein
VLELATSNNAMRRLASWKLYVVTILASVFKYTRQEQDHSRMFPQNDEYDPWILDPFTIYGSPYGGFSRATRSRLEALPLKLPDEFFYDNEAPKQTPAADKEEQELDERLFWEISDGLGRRYACRTYYNNELEPSSFAESMFEVPRSQPTILVEDEMALVTGNNIDKVDDNSDERYSDDSEVDEDSTEVPPGNQQREDKPNKMKSKEERLSQMIEGEFEILEVQRRLDLLKGVCVQRKEHYFTYE